MTKTIKLALITLLISISFSSSILAASVPNRVNANQSIAPTRDGDLLIWAIENNDQAKVEELLKKNVDPNSRGYKNVYMSPLNLAVSKNNKGIVEKLINYGADVKQKGIVSHALSNVEILALLIEHGADINDSYVNWSSPIHNATNLTLLDSADLLLKHGANINDQNNLSKRTPLQNAAQYGNELSVKWLLDHGADVNLVDISGQNAFVIGASYKANANILKMLLDHGSNLPLEQVLKITQGACRAGNLDALVFLVSKEVNLDSDACYTALAYVSSPNQDLMKWLSSRSKIKNIQVENESMLHVAVENNNLEIAKLLIASGADVNLKGINGRPPLDRAISHISDTTNKADYKEMITLLASHGADFDIKYGQQQTTALHELVKGIGCVDTGKEFQAQCNNLTETVELLIESGADVNAFDINSNTPLHFAAILNSIVLIEVLVNHGADLKFTNRMGQTPLMASMSRGSWAQTIERELQTIRIMVSLENKTGSKPDWEGLKNVANKVYDPKEKEKILSLIDQLEKNHLTIQ